MNVLDAQIFKALYGFSANQFQQASTDLLPKLQGEASSLFRLRQQPDALDGKPFFADVTLDGYRFVIPPSVAISRKKNVKTFERTGSDLPPVVKILGMGVANVRIQGFMKSTKTVEVSSGSTSRFQQFVDTAQGVKISGAIEVSVAEFPFDDLNRLVELFNKNESLAIESKLTSIYGISQIVLTSQPEIKLYPAAFAYSFEAIHDEDAEQGL